MEEQIDWDCPQELVASAEDPHALAGLLRSRFPGMIVAERDGGVYALFPLGLVFDLEETLREVPGANWDYYTPDWEDFKSC